MRFNVRVRINTAFQEAIHETRVYEAPTGLEAMRKAQRDEVNTSRGQVSTQGADPLPAEDSPIEPDAVVEKSRRGRPKATA